VLDLRKAVQAFYERELGLSYPIESVVISGGSRPVIYAPSRRCSIRARRSCTPSPPGTTTTTPSSPARRGSEIVVGPDTHFLPTAEAIRPRLAGVRLVCINSPLNPTGTVFSREQVEAIARLLVDENRRRAAAGERPVFAMWDQVYWTLTFGEARHYTPPELVPESGRVHDLRGRDLEGLRRDGAFGSEWAVGPPHVIGPMRDILGHVGAWAPRPEQVATARFLGNTAAIAAFHDTMIRGLRERLDLLYEGFESMRRAGLPVSSFTPQGAIYLTVKFDLIGKRIGDKAIRANEEIRRLLLAEAGFAVVPFQAFGLEEETGWMRLSVGAVSPDDIRTGLSRVRALLEQAS
jgi:aspartate aminotransferase